MADIDDVKILIEDNAETHGWPDEKLEALLSDGKSVNRIVAMYWRKRAQQTMFMTNVSESGSSRGLDAIYPRMVALAERYEKLADDEEAETPTEVANDRFMRTHPITRR